MGIGKMDSANWETAKWDSAIWDVTVETWESNFIDLFIFFCFVKILIL